MEQCGSPGDGGSSEAQAQCAPPLNPTPVPDVVGMGAEEACRALLREDFLAYVYGKRDAEGARPELVVAQRPRAGEVIQPRGVFLFVATLGYSRRPYVRAFRHERQSAWLDGIEGAFRHFGGVTAEVLVDNARALVTHHDAATREVRFNARFLAFAGYWGFRPRACAPCRARTKGKDERGVGYVKRNAIAGHRFGSWAEMEAHLARWTREVAELRIHGTTGEPPIERFRRDEAVALRPLNGRPPFRQIREVVRVVHSDGCVELDTNRYSVPWRLIGAAVTLRVAGGELVASHAGVEIARHGERRGRRERAVLAEHLEGIVGLARPSAGALAAPPAPPPELLRPLAEYERLLGGSW